MLPLFAAERPNVLLICVDDLKPTLGLYGDKLAQTPNFDRLGRMGIRFDKAYCNEPLCAPSRASLLSGSRPTSFGVYGFERTIRDVIPDLVTLPQYFKNHGYRAEAVGKILPTGHGLKDDEKSWSVPTHYEPVIQYLDPASTGEGQLTREEAFFTNRELGRVDELPRGPAWERLDVPDEAYGDGRIAAEGIRRLQAAKQRKQPFFLALGFLRPHLPLTAPKKYWDLYDPASFHLPKFRQAPAGAPPYAGKRGEEVKNYVPFSDPAGRIVDEDARTLIHAYYAAVSYVDAQIGKVLDELRRLDLDRDTIIVLWGDHGWHLGDHGFWTKHTNYEQANRIPLLFVAPGVTPPDTHTAQLAETVDIYPTLVQLAGLPKPADLPQPLDGESLVPVLKDPAVRLPGNGYVYSVYPKGGRLGRVIRTARYRLVEWKKRGAPPETADLELYDYDEDPDETRNLAKDRPEVVKELLAILHPPAGGQIGPFGRPRAKKGFPPKRSPAERKAIAPAGAKRPLVSAPLTKVTGNL